MTNDDKKRLCKGCYNDVYNGQLADECWMLPDSREIQVVQVGTWKNPPYRWRPETKLSCYHVQGCSFLPRDDCRVVEDSDEAVDSWR